jgi:hypothetical protein
MASSILTFNNRLPGVECQPALPPATQPIRLDVAGFVGLAERGPLDQPVPVEDINQYQTIFGGDLMLAEEDGIPVYANLPEAVRSFFDNGGRRCYVVRVAGTSAAAARWRVPGLALWRSDLPPTDVYVQAAWVGAWSTGMSIGTQLLQQPIAVNRPYVRASSSGAAGVLAVDAAAALTMQGGDVVQLDLGPHLPGLYLTVGDIGRTAYGWEVTVGAEISFLAAIGSPPGSPPSAEDLHLLRPEALNGLPAQLNVVAAYLLRMDLVVRRSVGGGAAQELEQWVDLRFNPAPATTRRPSAEPSRPGTKPWLDVLQPWGDPPPAPDLTRSLLLRTDPATMAGASTGAFVPLNMDQLGTAEEFSGPSVGSMPMPDRAGDDGLTSFEPSKLFLDPNLQSLTVYDLLAAADQLTSLSSTPVQLHGIHALAEVEEVALIAVPDAGHRNWSPAPPAPPAPPPPPPSPPPPPDWTHFQPCTPPFPPPPAPPVSPVSGSAVDLSTVPILDAVSAYDEGSLLEVQQALITLCAARADAVAVLSVPRHYTTDQVVLWHQAVTSRGRVSGAPLSYAGYWHPWLQVVEPATPQLARLRATPPDGTVCGTIAARENSRGVWVAPANLPIRGAVGLTPTLPGSDCVSLFNHHANLVVQKPGKFVSLSAHTLAGDASLLQISVRRLLILIRKVALRRGMRYVFEPNTDRFRNLVRLSFERLLTALQRLGAFVDFQVDTGSGVNTAEDIANGRLAVALRVAPTNPIEFITITLVRSGEGLFDVVGG